MSKKSIVIVDNNTDSVAVIQEHFMEIGLLDLYQLKPIYTNSREINVLKNECVNEIDKILAKSEIEAIFVDLALIEKPSINFESGLEVATYLRDYFISEEIAVISITEWTKEYRRLSEITFDERFHCLIIKDYLSSSEFNSTRFKELITKSKNRLKKQGPFSHNQRELFLRNYNLEGIKKNIEIQQDVRCQYQVNQIGMDTFLKIISEIFPEGRGTISYLRPGFSGSFLFKISVITECRDKSSSKTRFWVLKFSDNIEKLEKELNNYIALKDRMSNEMFPVLKTEKVYKVKQWGAIAIELKKNAITFFEYLNKNTEIAKIEKLLKNSLFVFLEDLYGALKLENGYIWNKQYNILKDDETGIKILNFIESLKNIDNSIKIRSIDNIFDKIKNLINKNYPLIINFDCDYHTAYTHGDLNLRNILVGENEKDLFFIDFVKSDQKHCMKDIAKLETDLIFIFMDSKGLIDTRWVQLEKWNDVLKTYDIKYIFSEMEDIENIHDYNIELIIKIVYFIRKKLIELLCKTNNNIDKIIKKQYLLSVLYHTLKVLTYEEITIQKKFLALKVINKIFQQFNRK